MWQMNQWKQGEYQQKQEHSTDGLTAASVILPQLWATGGYGVVNCIRQSTPHFLMTEKPFQRVHVQVRTQK